MKKYLPLILLGVGLFVVVGAFVFVKNSRNNGEEEEETVKEIPVGERPLVSLIPTSDGHWLKLMIEKIKVSGATSLDYELLYSLPDGRTQGVPGTVKLDGNDVTRDLLLGSESSGKFRYDEGVTGGTITIRFRDSKGKLIGKLSTQFTLTSPKKGAFEVTMDTFADGTKTFSSK
ncbi:MAG: hypothetical protein AAB535_00075 [Patescibacteria group bacterium]